MVGEIVEMVFSGIALSSVGAGFVIGSVTDLVGSSGLHVIIIPDFKAMVVWRICWADLDRKMRDAETFWIKIAMLMLNKYPMH